MVTVNSCLYIHRSVNVCVCACVCACVRACACACVRVGTASGLAVLQPAVSMLCMHTIRRKMLKDFGGDNRL